MFPYDSMHNLQYRALPQWKQISGSNTKLKHIIHERPSGDLPVTGSLALPTICCLSFSVTFKSSLICSEKSSLLHSYCDERKFNTGVDADLDQVYGYYWMSSPKTISVGPG